jgi:hypothetical protein
VKPRTATFADGRRRCLPVFEAAGFAALRFETTEFERAGLITVGAETTGDEPIGANPARFVRGASGVRAGGAPGT